MWWLTILLLAFTYAGVLAACRYFLHMLQLESYQLDGYQRFLKKNPNRAWGWTLRAGAISGGMALVLPVLITLFFTGERRESAIWGNLLSLAFFCLYTAYHVYMDYKTRQKKMLVFTGRMKRLCASLSLVCALALCLAALIFKRDDTANSRLMLMWLPPFLFMIAAPFLPFAAAYLALPIEERINHKFYVAAQNKLKARKDLIKIGITGSYGKTSTKFCLAAILSVKYNVLYTKGSINTPMGLSKVINTELAPAHQAFIAEMGARHAGDIRELTQLVRPRYAILTSVGPQHLDTFGDVETVANTKFELIEDLPKNGLAVFAADDGEVDKLYARAACEKRRAGLGKGFLHMRAEEIEVGAFGSRFLLIQDDGKSVRCETKLLGRHNISNLVLCCELARELGLTLDEIAEGVKKVAPVEHRLQLIPGAMNVIDDAFNSNPVGAQEALRVLNGFPGRHVIITPGFVEMGEDEASFNFKLGVQIARACDAAILVGPRHTSPIRKGLLQSGFAEDCIRTVKTLEEATSVLHEYAGNGDAVLFENDLPDNYSE